MKYIILLGDGMADEPLAALDGRTPLEAANTPLMDELAGKGEMGMVKTIPDGMKPGSDTTNLAVLGYNPELYYSGRSPLEALSMGVKMEDTDIAIRCNLVTLSEDGVAPEGVFADDETRRYAAFSMLDHSAGEITTPEAAELLKAVQEGLSNEHFVFYTGISYRHCLIWKGGRVTELTAPHDILGKECGAYLPEEPMLREMMVKSHAILRTHPVNLAREKKGLRPANSIWFWGAGTKPALTSFYEKTGKIGAMISAVDLLKGIAVGAGMRVIEVAGADGTLHTNYEGKARAAVKALLSEGCDFAYVHVEAPDEMGHQGSIERKIEAIEALDARVLRILKEEMDKSGEHYRLLVMPDHPTPIAKRTHTSDAVPFLLYDNLIEQKKLARYCEREAAESGVYCAHGYQMIDRLFQ